ncbi:hypothetical protein [Enterococcus italicus]|nr:hypothetical protein [Enterococcus italicus]
MNDSFVTSGKIGEIDLKIGKIDISPNVKADNVTAETPIIKE